MTKMESDVRLIKKYPNRRLYDTKKSCYITLDAVKELIEQKIPIKVIDSQTKKDITRSILLQIILDQESKNQPLFSTENLENFIRYCGENSRESFSYFMTKNLQFFQNQQEQMQDHFKNVMNFDPLEFWTKSNKRNMDMWQKMQEDLLHPSGRSSDPETNNNDKD